MIWPNAVTIADILSKTTGPFWDWLSDRKNRRSIPHRMEDCGYVSLRSKRKDGVWLIGGTRHVIYIKKELSVRDQHEVGEQINRKKEGEKRQAEKKSPHN